MDKRIESFLADVLALAGEKPGRRSGSGRGVARAKCEAIFRLQEPNNRRALEAGAQHHRPAGP